MSKHRRPKRRRKVTQTAIPLRTPGTASTSPPQGGAIRHWRSLSLLWKCVIAAGIVTGLATSMFALRPDISIESDISLDTSNPFGTEFRLQNKGLLSIYSVSAACGLRNVKTAEGASFRDFSIGPQDLIPTIAPGESLTVRCPFSQARWTAADIEIFAEYRPPFWPIRRIRRERFVGVADVTGILRWTHQPLSQ